MCREVVLNLAKRQLLEIVFLNFKLDGGNLCYETRKPFGVLAKGLSVVEAGRQDTSGTFCCPFPSLGNG
jgi:hypothetical protein